MEASPRVEQEPSLTDFEARQLSDVIKQLPIEKVEEYTEFRGLQVQLLQTENIDSPTIDYITNNIKLVSQQNPELHTQFSSELDIACKMHAFYKSKLRNIYDDSTLSNESVAAHRAKGQIKRIEEMYPELVI